MKIKENVEHLKKLSKNKEITLKMSKMKKCHIFANPGNFHAYPIYVICAISNALSAPRKTPLPH